ncbi:MAG: SDR family oxidoreductase [Chloroflexi bacterium]|nr:SDR family oxidoreductase [Chloroflexota bacterium]
MRAIDLSCWRALVTGGGAGIGRACAHTLAQAGAQVAVCDLNLAAARETVASGCPDGMALKCDVSDERSVAAMAEAIEAAWGGIDILLNNAGVISFRRGLQAITPEEWDRVIAVNLRGPYLVCRAFTEGMKTRRRGRIINFSSMSAHVGGIEVGAHYAASKAGILGLTRTLAKEMAPFGVTVNTIAPGFTHTGPVVNQLAGREAQFDAAVPLGRLGEVTDVADAVLFLASPLAGYLTGQTLDVNGGQTMR